MEEPTQIDIKKTETYTSATKPVWCPGCGNYVVNAALTKALTSLGIEKKNVLMVSGIGCSSVMPHQYSTYGIDSLHGRLLPVAVGAKLANDELTVIGTGGDGDGYGIGVGHLIHNARRNVDMTYLVNNNEIYGLTTGQASPTTMVGVKTKSTPYGDIESPLNPLAGNKRGRHIRGQGLLRRAYAAGRAHKEWNSTQGLRSNRHPEPVRYVQQLHDIRMVQEKGLQP